MGLIDFIKSFFPKRKPPSEEKLKEAKRKELLTGEEFFRLKRDRAIKEYNDYCDKEEIKKKDRH